MFINIILFLHAPSWEGCVVVDFQISRKTEKSTDLVRKYSGLQEEM
jgi:hypothetical protein